MRETHPFRSHPSLVCALTLLLMNFVGSAQAQTVRIATFNTSLNRCLDGRGNPCLSGGLEQALSVSDTLQPRQVAEQLQRIRPEIVLLNEFNYDAAGTSADLFQQNYLSVAQNVSRSDEPGEPIEYPYRYLAPVNTGIASGFDLDNNGRVENEPGSGIYAGDALGFGEFEGRYGMLLLSQYPIDFENIRSFQNLLWTEMPDALIPPNWYSEEELAVFRLSSKSHWDVPIDIDGQTVHFLASHPTPPVFDGAEDRNGRRNHDEIRLWADYLTPAAADYIKDDEGGFGGLGADASFVVLGDLNADPNKGDGIDGAVAQLLDHPRVNTSLTPTTPSGNTDTATFGLRADYVLPSDDLAMLDAQIFQPDRFDSLARLLRASDHRMVWVDVAVPEPSGFGMLSISLIFLTRIRRNGR